MNMIPIKSWIGDQEDRELQKIIPYMEKLVHAVSVLAINIYAIINIIYHN